MLRLSNTMLCSLFLTLQLTIEVILHLQLTPSPLLIEGTLVCLFHLLFALPTLARCPQ